MSSHNKIHKPRPAGSERTTGFCQKNGSSTTTAALTSCVSCVCVYECVSLFLCYLSYWLIGMVGRKKNARGHFRAMNKPDPEPIYILVYKV